MSIMTNTTMTITPIRRLSYGEVERMSRVIRKGEIYYANLSGNIGSEQGGFRPVLIIQNNIGNKYAPTTIVAPITSRAKSDLPTHLHINEGECGLTKDSIILFEQLRTIDKQRLGERIGELTDELMAIANSKLLASFG